MSHRSTPLLALIGIALVVVAMWWAARAAPKPTHAPTTSTSVSPATTKPTPDADLAAPPSDSTRTSTSAGGAHAADEGTWLTGRVVFPAGTPADEHAEVLASERFRSAEDAHAFPIDADGSFRVKFPLEQRSGELTLRARYVFLREPRASRFDEDVGPIVLEPELGGALRGRCTVPDGFEVATLAGTEVVASGRRLAISNQPAFEHTYRTRLGADGTFELGGLPPDEQYVLRILRSALAPFESGALAIEPGRVRELSIALARGGTIIGRVVDESGAPSAGCAVELTAPNAPWWFTRSDATTDGEGRFRIDGCPPGKTLVRARKEGFLVARSKSLAVEAEATIDAVELVLPRGLALRGRVQWPDGTPAANAALTLALENDPTDQMIRLGSSDPRRAKSGADGSFAFDGLTEGPFTLVASATSPALGACSARLPDAQPGDEALVVVLAQGHTLAVRVNDDLGAPFEGCIVRASFESSGWNEIELPAEAKRTGPGTFELRDLRPGTWKVKAARGNCDVERKVKIPSDVALDIVLPRPAHVAGIVRDARGSPAVGASVELRGEASNFLQPATVVRAKTDAEGRFRSPDVEPGTYTIEARTPSSAPSKPTRVKIAAGEERTDIELDLREGGTLAIEARDDSGRPDAGRRVDVIPMNVGGATFSTAFTTDETGRVQVPHVPAGEYQLQTSPSAREMQAATGDDGLVDPVLLTSARKMATAKIVEGVTTTVAIGPPERAPIRVTGRITQRGKPLEGLSVRAIRQTRTPSEKATRTDREGRYALELAESGQYSFQIERAREKQPGSEMVAQRIVQIGDETSFTLDFELPGGRITGRVVDAERKGIANVWVALERRAPNVGDAPFADSRATADDGRFVFDTVAGGEYALRATPGWSGKDVDAAFASATREGLELADDGAIDDIEIVLAPGGAVEGDITGADGARIAHALVFALDSAQRIVESFPPCTSDAAGHFRLSGITAGGTFVYAEKDDLAGVTAAVSVRAGETARANVVLAPATIVGIQLLRANGEALDVTISLRDERGLDHAIASRAPSSSASRALRGAHIGPLRPGRYVVRVEDGSLGDWSSAIDVTGAETQQITLTVPKR